ncbi:MAG: GIY-YIG nuclease family protein [Ekhidna sp.]|nr:GIY-YIG nuclease family protein [Ekhidna sp.]
MFVYILKSESDSSAYIGMSQDPERRLSEHNAGKVRSTKSKCPWKIVHLARFETRTAARAREKYFKSAAGRRFRKNHLGH